MLNDELKEKVARFILKYISSDDYYDICEDVEDGSWSYSVGGISYLVDFTTAYKNFIEDFVEEILYQFNKQIQNIEVKKVEKQKIILIINVFTHCIVYIDDDFLICKFAEIQKASDDNEY